MYLCRAASQALAARLSRAPSAASRLTQRAPLRQMSSGSVPGSSGENMIYYLITGVAAFGALFYTYKVVGSSRSNYIEHVNVLHERGQKHKADSYKGDEEETAEVTGADVATEEADASTAAGPAAQEESSGVTPETGGESDLPAADTSTAVEGAQQEAAANSEAPAVQVSSSDAFEKFNRNICGSQPADSCEKPQTLHRRHKTSCAVCHTTHYMLGPVFIAATDNLIRL
ncbi:protein MGARP isoform X4 [Gallus gallus]